MFLSSVKGDWGRKMQDRSENRRGLKHHHRKEIVRLSVFWCGWNIIKVDRVCGNNCICLTIGKSGLLFWTRLCTFCFCLASTADGWIVGMEKYWTDNDTVKQKCPKKIMFQYQFFHRTSHLVSDWRHKPWHFGRSLINNMWDWCLLFKNEQNYFIYKYL